MNRTYKLKHLANKGKQMKVIQTVRAYRDTVALIAQDQWRCFYESARLFNKQCDIKHIGTQLSERFKQTAKNILREGLSRLACPEKGAAFIEHREMVQSGRSLKQEIRSRLVA